MAAELRFNIPIQQANQVGNGRYLLRFDSLSKTNVGPIYVTAHSKVDCHGTTYDRATGVSQEVPLIYASGGKVRVRNTFTAAKGGVWTALPIVKRAGSAVYNVDDTVTETI